MNNCGRVLPAPERTLVLRMLTTAKPNKQIDLSCKANHLDEEQGNTVIR